MSTTLATLLARLDGTWDTSTWAVPSSPTSNIDGSSELHCA
jgi:hypothetical protein